MPELTFRERYEQTLAESPEEEPFQVACRVFLTYDQAESVSDRLAILYILHNLYSHEALTRNPFLTFFLDIIDAQPTQHNALEQKFVQCILDGSIANIEECTPQGICRDPHVFPTTFPPQKEHLDALRRRVARLVDDPLAHPPSREMDYASLLLGEACQRPLNDTESIILSDILRQHPSIVLDTHPSSAAECVALMEHNSFLATHVIPLVLSKTTTTRAMDILDRLFGTPATQASLQVVQSLIAQSSHLPSAARPSSDLVRTYLSNSMLICGTLGRSKAEQQLVAAVARLAMYIVQHYPLAKDTSFRIEIQTFCVEQLHRRLVAVTTLFQYVSSMSQT